MQTPAPAKVGHCACVTKDFQAFQAQFHGFLANDATKPHYFKSRVALAACQELSALPWQAPATVQPAKAAEEV